MFALPSLLERQLCALERKADTPDDDADLLEGEDPETDEIMCSHSRVGSIAPLRLERFRKVVRLCLRQNSIQEIDGLQALSETLEDIDLYDNLIGHIRGLDGLTKLKSLDLSFNKIKHIKNISHLGEVKELFLVANKISRIEGLEGLTKLSSLELGSNRIREIQNLDSLQNLEELWLAKNKITELTGLAGLPKLRLLSIQSNRIKDLSPLKDVPSLEELYISHNMLETLEGIQENPKLHVLDISNNKISSLSSLSNLAELEEVWASYNLLDNFNDVEKALKDKEGLTTVYFEGNPLQLRGPALYRNKVRLALPQVSQIDASESSYIPDTPLVSYNALTSNYQLLSRFELTGSWTTVFEMALSGLGVCLQRSAKLGAVIISIWGNGGVVAGCYVVV